MYNFCYYEHQLPAEQSCATTCAYTAHTHTTATTARRRRRRRRRATTTTTTQPCFSVGAQQTEKREESLQPPDMDGTRRGGDGWMKKQRAALFKWAHFLLVEFSAIDARQQSSHALFVAFLYPSPLLACLPVYPPSLFPSPTGKLGPKRSTHPNRSMWPAAAAAAAAACGDDGGVCMGPAAADIAAAAADGGCRAGEEQLYNWWCDVWCCAAAAAAAAASSDLTSGGVTEPAALVVAAAGEPPNIPPGPSRKS